MIDKKRRKFLYTLASLPIAGTAGWSYLKYINSKSIVVVGGGCAGVEFIRSIREYTNAKITLIEPNEIYHSCFMSNVALIGLIDTNHVRLPYTQLVSMYDIDLVKERALEINSVNKFVVTESGQSIHYDKLIVAPGVDFVYGNIDGYNAENSIRYPHAWKGKQQFDALKTKLQELKNGDPFIISSPKGPYKCPPGPYERASLVASFLKKHKPLSKVIVLDSKNSFAKKGAFIDGWKRRYRFDKDDSFIQLISKESGGRVVSVDNNTITCGYGKFSSSCISIIPEQIADSFAQQNNLTDQSGWCPVNISSLESTLVPDVHVLGDAAIMKAMPKSAFSAACQARICASAIASELFKTPPVDPIYHNVCYSLVDKDYSVSISVSYEPDYENNTIKLIPSLGGITPATSDKKSYRAESLQALDIFNSVVRKPFLG